jgi:molecular chaperone HtpG
MGTCVEVIIDDDEHPIFKYSFRELIFLLRSKTAVGDVGFIWDTPLDADVKLVHFDQGGRRNEVEFECRYLLPTECANKNEYISISEFEDWLKDSDRSDTEKRRKLLNKIVYVVEKKFQSGREIRYWSCFVPRREFWRSLSKNFGIEYMDADDDTPVEEPIGVGFSGGYVTSTKGMPTGISIEMKPRGSGGYLANFYMVVDDPLLRFDIGRKSIQGRQAAMLREIAYEKFREFINKTRRYMGGAVDPQILGWDRDEVFEEIEQLPALGSKVSRFSKRPNSQEATVAAMFFEQIGRGQMTDIIPLISGYKGRYDLYAKWKGRRVVIEFKFDLTGLFRDFTDERKMFDEINAVVVWEVTENDRAIAARRAMTLEVVEPSSLTIKQTFPGATKTLNMGDVNPIHVVELRYMLSC